MKKNLLTIGAILFLAILALSSSLSFAQDTDTTTPVPELISDDGSTSTITNTAGITATATATPIPSPTPYPTAVPPVGPWRGQYFNNPNWQGTATRYRTDYRIDYNWQAGTPFWPDLEADNFSIRWTNEVAFAPGFYQFNLTTDNQARLYINGMNSVAATKGYVSKPVFLTAGTHDLRVDYAHNTGYSRIALNWYQMAPNSSPFGTTFVTNNAGLAVREGAGILNRRLTQVADGTELILTGHSNRSGDWICVITPDGIVGWVNGYYTLSESSYDDFTVYNSGFNPVTEELPFGTAAIQNLQMRYGPGFDYFIANKLNVNEIVWAIGRTASNDWVLVESADTTLGWVLASGLRLDRPISELPVHWGATPAPEG
jgi:uncharacterized protein YgiM (DUF1202 family)